MRSLNAIEYLPALTADQQKDGTISSPGGYRSPLRIFKPVAFVAAAAVGTVVPVPMHSTLVESATYYQITGTGDSLLSIGGLSFQTFVPVLGIADRLSDLSRTSGLTWGEIARALGVSRRAIHHWLTGQVPSERHSLRVRDLESLISRLDTGDPTLTRSYLLSVDQSGTSELSRFQQASIPNRTTPLSSVTVGDFLSADSTAVAPKGRARVTPSTLKGFKKLTREDRRE